MFCTNCGRELAPGDRFCTGCGMAVHSVHKPTPAAASHGAAKWENAVQWMKHHESSAARFVPKQLAVRFPHVSAYVFLGAYACIIVVIAVICAAALGGGHDLSGTYRTDSFFPSPRLHSAAMEPLPLMTVRGCSMGNTTRMAEHTSCALPAAMREAEML